MEKHLSDIKPGECATVYQLSNDASLRRRLRDMGMIEGTSVACIGKSPGGDQRAYLIRGTVVAIRESDARMISVTRPHTGSTTWD